jgi:hypothetical protein
MQDAQQAPIRVGQPAESHMVAHVSETQFQDLGHCFGVEQLIQQHQIPVVPVFARFRQVGNDRLPARPRRFHQRVDMAGGVQHLAIMRGAQHAQQFPQPFPIQPANLSCRYKDP